MSLPEKPLLQPYKKHIFVCVGNSCHDSERSLELYGYLKGKLRELGLDQGDAKIMRSKSTCLGVCQGGPLAVVYPDSTWYCDLDEQKIDQIIDQHLVKGQPVEEWVFCPLSNA